MSDLIDRQALRAAHGLGADCHDCKRDMKSCQYDRDYSLMDFCEWLDDAPTASPWHRVEEEMPDLLQFVVVCNDDGKCVVAQYVGYQTDSLTPWRIAYTMYDTDAYYEMENGPVRYWMPLTSPPVNKMFTK